ncbi:MAG: tyrosine--tRNA ligase, partial [Gemmataceae bacterium]|nr:tyrosine--tRNA ligase [Gemmataceae bacterium]
VGLNEPAAEMFGKTMSIPDSLLAEWFTLLTDRTHEEVGRLLATPLEAKKTLAADIVRFYHGDAAAQATRADWDLRSKKVDPINIDEVTVPSDKLRDGAMLAVDLIVETKLAASKGEARRKIEEGAFNYGPDRTTPADVKATVSITDGLVIRLGRKILRVRVV